MYAMELRINELFKFYLISEFKPFLMYISQSVKLLISENCMQNAMNTVYNSLYGISNSNAVDELSEYFH